MTPADFKRLSIIERLELLSQRLIAGESIHKVKRELGLDRYHLSHLKRLGKALTDSSKDLIKRNGLSEGHARALARVGAQIQDRLVRDTIQKRWSVRTLEAVVKAQLEGVAFQDKSADAKYYEQLSTYISEQLGHPFEIIPGKEPGNGKISITYFGLDSFDGILRRMRIKLPDDI